MKNRYLHVNRKGAIHHSPEGLTRATQPHKPGHYPGRRGEDV